MSNLRINIRVFLWHFQVTDGWKFKIKKNEYHKGYHDGYFDVYSFDPFKKFKADDANGIL